MKLITKIIKSINYQSKERRFLQTFVSCRIFQMLIDYLGNGSPKRKLLPAWKLQDGFTFSYARSSRGNWNYVLVYNASCQSGLREFPILAQSKINLSLFRRCW